MNLLDQFYQKRSTMWWGLIVFLTILISYFHFTTPPSKGHIHLILMQFYLVPILIGAIQFGVIGGFGTAVVISLIVAPHIIFQWVGGAQYNFLGYLQIAIFNAIGYLTGLKAQLERNTRDHLSQTAIELSQTLEQLEQQSAEMSEMEEQLRHSDRLSVIGELMASLAHELRNPLASIRGSVEILNKELGEQEKRGEFFQILVDETDRMSSVVENYLALARRSKGTDIEYDAVEVIRNTCLMLGSRARKNMIIIDYKLPESSWLIQGDPNDLRQVMVNILLNAIQAMQNPGKVWINAVILNKESSSKTTRKPQPMDKILEICVEDEGCGIEAENLAEIFKPFYSTRKQGTGLGLSIVKRIVDSRKWQIKAARKKPTGTTFTLRISTK
ncbi:MAG: ATP-binding protein [Candidatus Marinimicrobia bacterium]|nr:ATP-binding protein [Candidatus Neomarinimicrobiota bacterium]